MAHFITPHLIAASRNCPRGRIVDVVNELITVKLGPAIKREEYDIMCIVHSTHTIPCPKPLFWVNVDNDVNAIVMSTIDGHPLRRSEFEDTYAKQLAQHFADLNKALVKVYFTSPVLTSPVYGGCMTFPLPRGQFLPGPIRPKDFTSVMIQGNDQLPENKPLEVAICEMLIGDGKLHFCHMDLSRLNILVKDDKIVGVVDWEYAGWYTHAMEWYAAFSRHYEFQTISRSTLPRYLEALASQWKIEIPAWMAMQFLHKLHEGEEEQKHVWAATATMDEWAAEKGREVKSVNDKNSCKVWRAESERTFERDIQLIM